MTEQYNTGQWNITRDRTIHYNTMNMINDGAIQ